MDKGEKRDSCSTIVVIKRNDIPARIYNGDVYIQKNQASPLLRLEDPVSLLIWKQLATKKSIGELVDIICMNYPDADYDYVIQDTMNFIMKLYNESIIQIVDGKEKLDYYKDFALFHQNQVEQVAKNSKYKNNSFRVSDKLHSYCESLNIPLGIHFELTYKCNFNCVHCYNRKYSKERKPELEKNKIINIIDELYDAGMFYLSFTGGEVFTKNDFLEILQYSCSKNLVISILSNGSLINNKFIKIIKSNESINLEISIYGFSNNTYNIITRSNINFESILNNLNSLKDFSNRVVLKFIPFHENLHEIKNFTEYCIENGFKFAFNPGIFYPKVDGNKSNVSYSLTENDYLKLIKNKIRGPKLNNIFSLSCVMGRTRGAITPDGDVSPCEFLTAIKFGNLNEFSFRDIWYGDEIEKFRKKTKEEIPEKCSSCEKTEYCGRCPAFSFLETGSFEKESQTWCKYAELGYKYEREKKQL